MCDFVSVLVVDDKNKYHVVSGKGLNSHGDIYREALEKFPNINTRDLYEVEWSYPNDIEVRTPDDEDGMVKEMMIQSFLKREYTTRENFIVEMIKERVAKGDYSFVVNANTNPEADKRKVFYAYAKSIKRAIKSEHTVFAKEIIANIDDAIDFIKNECKSKGDFSRDIICRENLRQSMKKSTFFRDYTSTLDSLITIASSRSIFEFSYIFKIIFNGRISLSFLVDKRNESTYYATFYKEMSKGNLIYNKNLFYPKP